ncbi:hypothetical protein BGZ93_007469 [Podila epicladia]|nr:hypothetical protein BGZ93_007469 [Podila epicladia]
MAFTFPSLLPSLPTFFVCGSDPTLTSPTTLSLISTFCHGTNSLGSHTITDESSALTIKNDAGTSMSLHQPLTSGSLSTGSLSPFKESSGNCLAERELVRQAEGLNTLSLNDEKHYKKQHPQKQVYSSEYEFVDDTLLEQIFEIEKLKMLLEITDHDIEQFHLQQRQLNATSSSKATVPTATTAQHVEIKRSEEKDIFVHPGFYTLPSSSSNIPQTSSKFSRKRSLQENVLEANRARAMTPPEECIPRRHSMAGNAPHMYSSPMTASSPMIPGPLMQSHPPSYSHQWPSYATPPKTPSTPSTSYYPPSSATTSSTRCFASASPLQNNDDLPPGQPFVLAYDLSSPSFTTRSTPSAPTTTPYPPPRSDTSLPFPGKKRRSSKFKMDPCQLNGHSHDGQSQQRHPYPMHKQKQERQHPLPASSSSYMFSTKASATHRHNPAQVPASMIPPDHFVFQEALQKQPWLRNVVGLGDIRAAHPFDAQRGVSGLSRLTSNSPTQKRLTSTSGVTPQMASSVHGQPSSSYSLSLPSEKVQMATIVIDEDDGATGIEARRRESAAFAASLTTLRGFSTVTLAQ